MNYYIIPKNNFNIRLNVQLTNNKIEPYISYSLIFYINDIYNQLFKIQENYNDEKEDITIDYVNKIVNPFEFIHSNVPGSKISVSKVKPDSIIFFELMELFQVFNINDVLSLKPKINIAHLTNNYTSTNYLLNMLREDNEDNILSEDFDYGNLYDLFIRNNYNEKLDLIICEFPTNEYSDTKKYINNMILVLLIIVKYQMNQGMCILKIDNILYKAVIDVIFIITSIYDKIYLVKPTISNVTKSERYLICKGFNETLNNQNKLLGNMEEQLISKLGNSELINDKCINSLIDNELPYYLINRLEESNLVIAQQQLESYDQIINIFKNKNREEKIEHLKRSHIQKCIQWCEKNQLPHNKFIDKVNIFLTPKKRPSGGEEDNVVESV
jgi:hypothetical protein